MKSKQIEFKVFCDLDGVLADFDKKAREILGQHPKKVSDSYMWPMLQKHGNFFGSLDKMPGADELWTHIKPYNPTILTGVPRGKWAEPQKRQWVGENFGWDVQVITCWSKEKYKWAGKNHILIDDRKKAQGPWEGTGGTFVLFEDTPSTIQKLKDLGV